jgi:uncharacterized protein YndB with AHSA1/START domain
MKTGQQIITDREMVFTRLLNAPRELVFEVWTNPDHLANWWGPDGFTITTHSMEVKINGIWLFIMHGPDGRDYPNKMIYLEIKKPERLVYKHMDDSPELESVSFLMTIDFKAIGNKTEVTMRMTFDSAEEFQRVAHEYGAIEGAHQTLSRLEALVSELTQKV